LEAGRRRIINRRGAKSARQRSNYKGESMKAFKRSLVGLAIAAVLGTGAAQAQVSDNVVKIGVLSDMSSLYTDLAGAGSVLAAKMAVEDSGIEKRGVKVEIISADHQNKPDVGSAIARQWYDTDKVDVIVDVPNSGVALAVNQITKDKGKAFLVSGAASSDLTGKACSPNTIHWTYDTWMLANGTGSAIVKTGGDTWFFLTADYAFGHALERDTEAVVLKSGGKVLGKVRAPLNTQDFSSFLLQAQASKAKIVGPRQRRRRHDELDQAGRRVRHRQGRTEPCRVARISHRHPRARAADRARAHLHRDVLLGHERQTRAFAKRFAPLDKGSTRR
jgi:ABC-type branched-subunit amino acid transport system substrate-binding protein